MGGPSAAIYYSELIQLGVQRIVRVGTAGGIAPGLKMGDTVIAISATADDQTVLRLTDGDEHAPTVTFALLETAVRLAREGGATVFVGPVVTSALFYDPRPGMVARWKARGHLAIEMEISVLYTLAAIHGIEAVGLMTVSDMIGDDGSSERISDEELRAGVDKMMQVACAVAIS
jgi:purine-nucleoside phosphorylase